MYNIRRALMDWNGRSNERQKLQHVYVLLMAVMTIAAGLVSLFSPLRGRQLMYVVLALLTAFVINGVVWHLLHSVVVERLDAAAPLPTTGRSRSNQARPAETKPVSGRRRA